MAPVDLHGGTLGDRHQHYNKLLREAIANRQPVTNLTFDDTDVENLLKIDLACHNKDVNYIINVFKCSDMLCVSRALAQSIWLITDPQYAHIINPDYLHTHLLPHMSTKAFIKLNKHIRHNIRDEARAELFYLHEQQLTDAIKWLPRCSGPFIETKILKHIDHCKMRTLKRLCEKSNNIFEIVIKNVLYNDRTSYAQAAKFLLKADVDKYLDIIIERVDTFRNIIRFNDKATDIIMKKSPKRVIDNLDQYASFIDIATFSKYLKTDEIKTFLYTQAKKDDDRLHKLRFLFNFDSLKYFIKRLPKAEQFDFVYKVFINRENVDAIEENLKVGSEAYDMKKLYNAVGAPSYIWYRYASFQRAFEDITGMISKDLDNNDKARMLTVLISCADNNLQHIQTLLQYYLDKHRSEKYVFTFNFTSELCRHTNIHQYDEKTWNYVSELFKILKIYDKYNYSYATNTNIIFTSIVIYKILRDQSVPALIQQHLSFVTLLPYASKVNKEQKEKIFRYAYDMLIGKLKPITTEEELSVSMRVIETILQLLRDWKKQLIDYPVVIDKIKECVKTKTKNAWEVSLTPIYNFNKSWRKYMFEESVAMNPCEGVCLNALKHDPQLLQRYKEDVNKLRTNDAVSLRRLLAKLRVYWPHSLAQHWTDAYLLDLNRTDGHKVTVRGICTALPQKPLLEFVEKYKPAKATIDWNKMDRRVLSIQQCIAKTMHIARPQPSPDTILLYAKGDYLQSALSSLLAIFYNLNITEIHDYISKLLDAPVSVQKHGIRLAYQRLGYESYSKISLEHWKTSKNSSIRATIFELTFECMCHENDPTKVVGLWELIEQFIDNLTYEEGKDMYHLMSQVAKVPQNVRAKYLMKSYKFIKSLIQNVKEEHRHSYQVLSDEMVLHSREVMEDMCPDFVAAAIQEYIDKDFFISGGNCGTVHSAGGILSVLFAYLLCAKNESIQTERYDKVFVPIMQRALAQWNEKRNGKYIIRKHFQYLLRRLSEDLREYAIERHMIIPVKMFLNIQEELDKNLPVSENYMLLTKWKLTVAVALLADKVQPRFSNWVHIEIEIAPEFGKMCSHYLKEDVTSHFPSIYKLFSKALKNLLITSGMVMQVYESMMADAGFVQGYLTAIEGISSLFSVLNVSRVSWKQIFEHPSLEVKMHYYFYLKDNPYVSSAMQDEPPSSNL